MGTRIILILAAGLSVAALACGGCGGEATGSSAESAAGAQGSSDAEGADTGAGGSSGGLAAEPSEAGEARRIVVTYAVLGSLVQELVGGSADVEVLMPNGVDPHDWQPSAKDVEAIGEADLVVANGLDLEEALHDVLAEAEDAGVPVFRATEHVDLRPIGVGEAGSAAEEPGEAAEEQAGAEHGAGSDDPHIWTDPLAMKSVIRDLATLLEQRFDLPVAGPARELEARLDALDERVEDTLSTIPAADRKLVTGHESMGYFADRYGFTLVGALVPSFSSQAEASAAELAELTEQIEAMGVGVIFIEIGTPSSVADAIGDETGATVVELPSHNLPDDGSYFTFMQEIADRVAGALAP